MFFKSSSLNLYQMLNNHETPFNRLVEDRLHLGKNQINLVFFSLNRTFNLS